MRDKYICPICGYRMSDPPSDFNICPSCGVEFGYSDWGRSFSEIREEWVRSGMPWQSRYYKKPKGWNPQLQLIVAGLVPVRISAAADEELPQTVYTFDHGQIAADWSLRCQNC